MSLLTNALAAPTDDAVRMKPGERVIWLYSPRHSIVTGWRTQRIPAVIVDITRRRIRIRAWHRGKERIVHVHPDNVLCDDGD